MNVGKRLIGEKCDAFFALVVFLLPHYTHMMTMVVYYSSDPFSWLRSMKCSFETFSPVSERLRDSHEHRKEF